MELALRPHHFLCLKGYKGYNYSKEQVTSWDTISKQLREDPETDIMIISGKDDLCKKCPNDGVQSMATCRQDTVSALDKKIQDMLGLVTGQVYKFKDIMAKLNKIMTPEKHAELCSECSWWRQGLCRDSFEQKAPFLSVTSRKAIDPSKLRLFPQEEETKAA